MLGASRQSINRLLKQHRQMADAFKMMSRDGGKGMARMAQMMGAKIPGLPGGGGADLDRMKSMGGGKMAEPSADDLKAIQDRLAGLGGGQLPGGLPGLPGFPPKK